MALSNSDLQSFHEFATTAITGNNVNSMRDLFELWLLENPTEAEQAESLSAVQEGLANIEAGQIYNFESVNQEIRNQHGWSDKS